MDRQRRGRRRVGFVVLGVVALLLLATGLALGTADETPALTLVLEGAGAILLLLAAAGWLAPRDRRER